ncbi:MAG: hypothetical protein KDN05_06140 [Verrucomicrobiae bacterium]|nr:hypothetical protein [Verrucomicrobiae bacterium]
MHHERGQDFGPIGRELGIDSGTAAKHAALLTGRHATKLRPSKPSIIRANSATDSSVWAPI